MFKCEKCSAEVRNFVDDSKKLCVKCLEEIEALIGMKNRLMAENKNLEFKPLIIQEDKGERGC